MLILPKIKFKRDPEELEEEIEEDLEEEAEEEAEEAPEEEPEQELEDEPEQKPKEEPEQEIEEEPEQELEDESDSVIEEEAEEEIDEETPEDLEASEEISESIVTEAVPMPEKPKKVREKKPKQLICFRETEDGILLTVMLGKEQQEELFVSFFEEGEDNPAEEPLELSIEQLGKRIKKSLKNNRIRGKRAAYVIPEEDSRIRRITMQRMPEKQIRFNLPMEFRKDFTEGLSGKLFDYAHLSEEESGEEQDEMELLAAAVPLERMERARAMVGFAGRKLQMAAPESLSEESFFPDTPFNKKRKNVINFAHLGEKRLHPAAVAAIVAVMALLAVGVAKFGIMERYARLQEAILYAEQLKENVEMGEAELSDSEATKEEYAHLTWSQMTDEECEQIERIRIGALLNFISGQGAKVRSATLSGTLLMVSVTADSLETISDLTAAIEEQDIVESCSVTTAEKEEMASEVNYSAPPSDVIEVEVDDSIPVEEAPSEDRKRGKEDQEDEESTEEEGETEETAEETIEEPEALPEVEYPEGSVDAQLRIYLKKRSDTLGVSEEIEELETELSEEEEVISEEEDEALDVAEESEPDSEEDALEEEAVDEEAPEDPYSEEQDAAEEDEAEDENLPTITLDENGNPIAVTRGVIGEAN